MLSGIHHPANVTLHGRVGTMSGLPLPGSLQERGRTFDEVQKTIQVAGEIPGMKTKNLVKIMSPHLCVNWPTLLYHRVEAWRHGLVLPVRCARSAGRAGTAVVGRVRHSSRQRASYRGRLGSAKEFVCQSVCGD